MGARERLPRAAEREPSGQRPGGQHFLRSRRIADELVDLAGIGATDDLVEIGAGAGRLTEALARRCRRVTAVELDPELVERLRRRFARDPSVAIVAGDILTVPLPLTTHRVFGNVPFALTTAILRRLLDAPAGPMVRADLLVQSEAARKRASTGPSNLLSLGWLPWWDFGVARRVPRGAFDPPPHVDAAMLTVERRPVPLLRAAERSPYVATLRTAFRAASQPVGRTLRSDIPPRSWKRLARERGVRVEARPSELDVFDWVDVFRACGPGHRAAHRRD